MVLSQVLVLAILMLVLVLVLVVILVLILVRIWLAGILGRGIRLGSFSLKTVVLHVHQGMDCGLL